MPTVSDAVGRDGPLVRVELGISTASRRRLRTAKSPIPQSLTLTALIDTGAEITCIDPRIVGRLSLQPGGSYAPINAPGLGGLVFPDSYDIDLTVLHPSGIPADHMVVSDLEVADVSLNVFRIDVLLGRDVLALCDFNYLGRASQFALTY
jgi:hypothetical protein